LKLSKETIYINLLCVLCVFYIFGPPINGFPTSINLGMISSLFILFIFILKLNKNIQVPVMSFKMLVILMMFLLIPLLHSLLFGFLYDLEYEYMTIRMLYFSFTSFIVSVLFYNSNIGFRTFIVSIMYFIVFNTIITLVMFFVPSLQYYVDIIVNSSGNISNYEETLRFRGLTNFEGASLSLMYSFYFLLLGFGWESFRIKERKNFLFFSIFVIIAIFLTGRTGLISLIVIGCILLIYFKKLYYLLIFFFLSSLLLLFSYLAYIGYFSTKIDQVLGFALDPFITLLFVEGEMITSSNQILLNMLYLPSDTFTLLFGEGAFQNHSIPSTIYRLSDSGFVRQIFEYGVIITGIFWGGLFLLSLGLKKEFRKLYLSVLFILFLFNIKQPFIFGPHFYKIITLIYFISLQRKNTSKKVYI